MFYFKSLCNIANMKPERGFAIIGCFFLLIWQVVFPPFEAPDETDHYLRAYMISEGKWIAENDSEGNIGAYFPSEVLQVIDRTDRDRIFEHPEQKQKFSDLRMAARINLTEDSKRVFRSTAAMSLYSPIVYVPQALGIFLGRLCHLPILYGYQLAKIGNSILFLCLSYFAIKKMPVLKYSLLTVCLLPITLQEASSVAADATVIGVGFAYIAYILFLSYDQSVFKITRRNIIVIGLFMLTIALAKTAYLPLCLLYFLLPQSKFSSRFSYWKCGVLLLLMAFIIWSIWSLTFLAVHVPPFASRIGASISSYGQTVYVFNHPIEIFVRMLNTIPRDIIMTFLLGCSDVINTSKLIIPYALLFILPVFSRNEDCIWTNIDKNMRYHTVFLFSIFTVLCMLIHLAIFITWPQPMPYIIFGVHGRYFIPFVMLLAVVGSQVLKVTKFISDIEKIAALYYVGLSCMLGCSAFWIWQRYYG